MAPLPGEVWFADLDPAPPARGHEQAGPRPVLVVSNAAYNASPRGIVVVVPFTTRLRTLNLVVEVNPPEGGLRRPSQAICDQIRAVHRGRLLTRWGVVQRQTLDAVKLRIGGLLEI